MKDLNELNTIYQGLISKCTNLTITNIILANQGRPPPDISLYATYNPVPIRAYGQPSVKTQLSVPQEEFDPDLGDDWQDFEVTKATAMEIMLSINFFNEGAAQAAMMLHNANFRHPVSEYLFKNKIAMRYVSNPRNLSAHYQSGIQPRWQADIHLFVEHEVSYAVLRAAGFTVFTSTN